MPPDNTGGDKHTESRGPTVSAATVWQPVCRVRRPVGQDTVTIVSLGPAFPARAPDERAFPHRLGALPSKPRSSWRPSPLGLQVLLPQAEQGMLNRGLG